MLTTQDASLVCKISPVDASLLLMLVHADARSSGELGLLEAVLPALVPREFSVSTTFIPLYARRLPHWAQSTPIAGNRVNIA